MIVNGLYNPRSYAYKEGQSTINALTDMIETWMDNVDDNFQNINMFLDLSAAFDYVEHDTLLEKIKFTNLGTNHVIYLSHICLIGHNMLT